MEHTIEHSHGTSCEAPFVNNTLYSFNSHVTWSHIPFSSGPILDKILATLLTLLLSGSLLGNTLALRYFISTRRRDLGTLLYLAICVSDILTVVLNLPVTVSLFQGRYPGAFNFTEFCIAWDVVSMTLSKVSLLLVMLLSVSRAISIAFPFLKINRNVVICIPLIYSVFQVALYSGMSKVAEFSFTADTPYCYRYYSNHSSHIEVANQISQSIQSGLSPVVTFLSFLVCLVNLLHKSSSCPLNSQQQNRHAAVTVTMFTGLFLLCYTPYMILIILESITFGYNDHEYPDPFFNSCFMYWYSWIVARVLFPVVNSTLDPVLYYWRMSGFRAWLATVKQRFRRGLSNREKGFEKNFRRQRIRVKSPPVLTSNL
ncbi:hypothetical protein ACHWQZ_G009205 [Mnemiopsis leidyi]